MSAPSSEPVLDVSRADALLTAAAAMHSHSHAERVLKMMVPQSVQVSRMARTQLAVLDASTNMTAVLVLRRARARNESARTCIDIDSVLQATSISLAPLEDSVAASLLRYFRMRKDEAATALIEREIELSSASSALQGSRLPSLSLLEQQAKRGDATAFKHSCQRLIDAAYAHTDIASPLASARQSDCMRRLHRCALPFADSGAYVEYAHVLELLDHGAGTPRSETSGLESEGPLRVNFRAGLSHMRHLTAARRHADSPFQRRERADSQRSAPLRSAAPVAAAALAANDVWQARGQRRRDGRVRAGTAAVPSPSLPLPATPAHPHSAWHIDAAHVYCSPALALSTDRSFVGPLATSSEKPLSGALELAGLLALPDEEFNATQVCVISC